MRRSIFLVLTSFFVIWAVEAFWLSPSPPGDFLWVARQEGMLLTGILALGAMTAIMVLALRPRWVESPLGGMDKAYRLHKWLGIIAITLSLAHWLAKQSKPLIATAIGSAGKLTTQVVRKDPLVAPIAKGQTGLPITCLHPEVWNEHCPG